MSTLSLDDLKGSFKVGNKTYYYRSEYISDLDKVSLIIYYGKNKTCNLTYSNEYIYYTVKDYDKLNTVIKSLVDYRAYQLETQLLNNRQIGCTGYSSLYVIDQVSYLLTVTFTEGKVVKSIDNRRYGDMITSPTSDEDKSNLITASILELKEICNTTPISISESLDIGDCHFQLDVKYIKEPCSTEAYVKVYMDDNLYKESPITITSNDIINNIQNLKLTGEYNYKKLKESIKNIPVSTSEDFTVGRLGFRISTNLFKELLNGIVRYEVYCDDIKYADGIVDVTVSTLSTVAKDVKDYTDSIKDTLKRFITTIVPSNTTERFRTNGLYYILGREYIKSPGNSSLTLNILVDDDILTTKMFSLSFETLKSNSDSIVQQSDIELTTVKLLLDDNTLVNSSYLKSVNNFTYAIGIAYVKDAGTEVISLDITVDNRTFHSYSWDIKMSNLIPLIKSIKEYTETQISSLYSIIDQSPKDTNIDKFLVDNFEYTGGIAYSKSENNPSVTVKFYIQNKLKQTVNYNLYAETLQANMNSLKSKVNTRFENLKNTLYSIAPTVVTYNVDSCYFNITILYDKVESSNYVKVTPTLDGEPILEPVPITFSKTKSIFTNKGNELVNTIKNKLSTNTPRTNIGNYVVHGFTYYTGYKFTKTKNNKTVTITTLIDGVEVGESKAIDYDINDSSTLLDTAIAMYYKIRNKLDNDTPEDYSSVLSVHGFYFALGSTFLKNSNSKTVTIKTVLDGTVHKTTTFTNFSIYNVQALLDKAKLEEDNITDKLVNVPSNVQKIWSYDDRFFFLVDIEYEKDANSNEIRSKLMIDKEQHGEIIKSVFNINSISSIPNLITEEANSVEEKYRDIVPTNVRRMYSKNGYHFSVDSYFSKEAGSTNLLIKIVVTYLDKDQEDMTIILTTSLKNKLFKNVVNNIYMIGT